MAKVKVRYKTRTGYQTKTIQTILPTNDHGNILFNILLDNMTQLVKKMLPNEYRKMLWIQVLE